jgi:hypothetical protein
VLVPALAFGFDLDASLIFTSCSLAFVVSSIVQCALFSFNTRRNAFPAHWHCAAAMVAKVSCNLTPRHPPSQVVDNLPRYDG